MYVCTIFDIDFALGQKRNDAFRNMNEKKKQVCLQVSSIFTLENATNELNQFCLIIFIYRSVYVCYEYANYIIISVFL